MSKHDVRTHYGCFLGFFFKKVFETNLNFMYQQVRNKKNKGSSVYQLLKMIHLTRVPFFGVFTRWYLKLRFVTNTFWTKNSKASNVNLIQNSGFNFFSVCVFSLFRLLYLSTSIVQRLEVSKVQNLEISRRCTVEVER